jgi:hypothetical protein
MVVIIVTTILVIMAGVMHGEVPGATILTGRAITMAIGMVGTIMAGITTDGTTTTIT